jgi:putative transposase
MLQGLLRGDGLEAGRLHVATLMKKMGIEAIYRRPNTSKPAPGHKNLSLPPAQAGGHPAQPGLGYGPDIYSDGAGVRLSLRRRRLVSAGRSLSWRLSITMEAAFCIEAVEEALARYGKPEIFNTDQGSQFTSIDFTAVLKKSRDCHLDGRQGRLAGQCLRRAALAVDQIRGGLPSRLQDRVRGPRRHWPISYLLQ